MFSIMRCLDVFTQSYGILGVDTGKKFDGKSIRLGDFVVVEGRTCVVVLNGYRIFLFAFNKDSLTNESITAWTSWLFDDAKIDKLLPFADECKVNDFSYTAILGGVWDSGKSYIENQGFMLKSFKYEYGE